MNADDAITTEPATPEYVLGVFQDAHRQSSACDEADPDFALSFDTTIADWRDAYDLLGWVPLASAINKEWNLDCPLDEWRNALEPAEHRTVRDFCDLVARHAVISRIRPASSPGSECTSADAFLAVRSLLLDAGADVDALTPSTPLAEYARRYMNVFLGPIAILAPGSLPSVRIWTSRWDFTIWAMLLSVVLLIVSACVESLWAAATAVVVFGTSYLASKFVFPKQVAFGELKTFEDLAQVLAENTPTQEKGPRPCG
jgi:hypothetical protein